MEIIGIDAWKINDKELMQTLLKKGFEMGYRLIDTAAFYSNEMMIGKAVWSLGLPRRELTLQDKVWRTNYGYDATIEACRKSIKKLKTDYLDIYLIHWPASLVEYKNWKEINAETWRVMEIVLDDATVKKLDRLPYIGGLGLDSDEVIDFGKL